MNNYLVQNGRRHAAIRRKRSVVLFGEVLADIFPDRTVLGGAPFNVARHLRAFDENPVLITRLGSDALGEEIFKVMLDSDMDTLGVQCCKRHPTGQVQVQLKADGSHQFEILPEQAYDYIHPAVVRMITLSTSPALVYFGTLSQRSAVSARALKNVLRSTDAPKFLDINLREPWFETQTIQQSLQDADIVKLNDEELKLLAAMFELTGQTAESQAGELISRFALQQLLVTCGEAGAWHMNSAGKRTDTKTKHALSALADTVGAGDGFSAVCILGALRRWPIARTLERANKFAAAICGIRGAVPDNADFYRAFIKEWGG